MNKSALRNFAVWARRDLIRRISDRANLLGVYEGKQEKPVQATTATGFMINGLTFEYKTEIRDNFIKRVKEIGFQDTIEEIAYTWFNRIVAIRFMEVNGYLVNGKNKEKIYVIGSSLAGKSEPDAITNADKLSFVDIYKVYDYQDKNDTNGLYRYVLTSQCNELNKVMPQMFEQISDYVEMLLPDHLLDKDSIIDHLTHDIDDKDFNITIKDKDGENASQVEIIGWLYQFYISEKKDQVFANKDKITKGNLPAVTQLFTPDWIVKYMAENSLGKMWIDGHKNSKLKQELKYYVEEAEQTDEVKIKIAEINKEYAKKNVTEITFIDPCCGSGHILVYAFDLLYKMYLESGYLSNDIPSKIIQNNLIGIDVDKRAVQLTSFALTMKALSYDKDFLSKNIFPTVIDVKESNSLNPISVKEFVKLAKLENQDEEIIEEVIEKFKDAELYGSLIKDFRHTPEQYDILLKSLQNNVKVDYFYNIVDQLCIKENLPLLCDLLKQAYILSSKYEIMATNPPYLSTSTNDKLKEFAYTFYPDSKTDMFAMFMEVPFVKENGFLAMINMQSWMFLITFYKLRGKLSNQNLISMLHLGPRAFEDIGGEVVSTTSFVFRKETIESYYTTFYRLVEENSQKDKENAFLMKQNKYIRKINDLVNVPENPLAYWLTDNLLKIFLNKKFSTICEPKSGIMTGDDKRFVRLWEEIDFNKFSDKLNNNNDLINSKIKWVPITRGGSFRKWYGNVDSVLNMKNGGYEISHQDGNFRLRDSSLYFQQGIAWTMITTTKFSARFVPTGYLFGNGGPTCFMGQNIYKYLGFLNSNLTNFITSVFNPTMNIVINDICNLPINQNILNNQRIDTISQLNVNMSKLDWDQFETSWDFKKNPLI